MSDTRFTVRRLGWHQAPHGDDYIRRLPTAEPLARFDTFDEAEYERRRREYEARLGKNPFRFGGATLYFQTSLDGPRLHDWLLDGGIDPPTDLLDRPPGQLRHRDWVEWWDAFAHTWTEDQLAHAWQGLDKVRFFDVAEEPAGDRFRVLVEPNPEAPEGGALVRVYRNAYAAAAACAGHNAGRRRATLDHGWFGLDPGEEDEERWARRVEQTVFFRVVE